MGGRGEKRKAFTDAQNAIFREELRQLIDDEGWSQAKVGEALKIRQQSVGRLKHGVDGFSYASALELAKLRGLDSPHALIARRTGSPSGVAEPWAGRDAALLLARRVPYDEAAIKRVVARFAAESFASRPTRWWLDRIVHEAAELDAERAESPTPPPASVMATKAPSRKRIKVG